MTIPAIDLRAPRMLTLAVLSGMTLFVGRVEAQRVGGVAYGSYVRAGGITAQSPVAALPDTGGYVTGEAETFGVPSAVNASWLTAVTTGAVDDAVSSSQSTSEVENVSVLGGVIQADIVTAVASSYLSEFAGTGSSADGSGFVNLVVNGTPISTDVAPNTRMSLPGVGYVVLNEQIADGDGVSSTGITINLIHVVLQNALTGATTGEIIVGSATSSVGT